jgi:hypothetical protein
MNGGASRNVLRLSAFALPISSAAMAASYVVSYVTWPRVTLIPRITTYKAKEPTIRIIIIVANAANRAIPDS